MPRLSDLSEVARNAALTFPAQVNEGAPYTTLTKPLSQCRVAIVTSAGYHMRDDRPFTGGDQTYRVIPSSATAADLVQSHASIGFDRVAAQRDINIVVPLDRLRELVERGELGGLGPNHYSFMGAQRDPAHIIDETGPEVARLLLDEGVDVAVLTPT